MITVLHNLAIAGIAYAQPGNIYNIIHIVEVKRKLYHKYKCSLTFGEDSLKVNQPAVMSLLTVKSVPTIRYNHTTVFMPRLLT